MSMEMFGDGNSLDPLVKERVRCLESNCDVRKLFLELRECTERVTKKITYTAETCQQEIVDLVMEVDHCVADKAFVKMR